MTISISKSTVNNNTPAGTLVGVLTAKDASNTVSPCISHYPKIPPESLISLGTGWLQLERQF